MKASGVRYEVPLFSDFVESSVNQNLPLDSYKKYLLDPLEFEKLLTNKVSIFSKHSNKKCNLHKSFFDVEGIIERKSEIKDLDEREDDYLGQNNSDTEFSSASSMDIQDRIIDIQDIKPEFFPDDYMRTLVSQEEQDKKILQKILHISD